MGVSSAAVGGTKIEVMTSRVAGQGARGRCLSVTNCGLLSPRQLAG